MPYDLRDFEHGPTTRAFIETVRRACESVPVPPLIVEEGMRPAIARENALGDFGSAVARVLPPMTDEWASAYVENPALLDLGTLDNVRAAMIDCRYLLAGIVTDEYMEHRRRSA